MFHVFSPVTELPATVSDRADGEAVSALSVDRRRGLSVGEFRREYANPGRPVVIEDALAGWPALSRWTPEFFADRYPDKAITFRDGSVLPMRRFIEALMSSTDARPAPYWTNAPIAEHFPDLLADIDPNLGYFGPNWAERKFLHRGMRTSLNRGAMIEMYIGGQGGAFPVLHWDGLSTHAFLMQISGVKKYWVWPPSETPFLYPLEDPVNVSPIRDVENPDLVKYPLFARARGGTLELHPGQLLFVPTRWWHTAKMLTPSITLSINTVNTSNWANFAQDMTRNAHGPARLVKSTYLAMAGIANYLTDVLRMV
jgi:histone arginine demethylase JMJD6